MKYLLLSYADGLTRNFKERVSRCFAKGKQIPVNAVKFFCPRKPQDTLYVWDASEDLVYVTTQDEEGNDIQVLDMDASEILLHIPDNEVELLTETEQGQLLDEMPAKFVPEEITNG